MTKENLLLWNKVSQTNPDHTKKVTIGKREYTSIDPQYQIKSATEQFGPYGSNWGLKEINHLEIPLADESIVVKTSAVFFFPGGSFPIHSSAMLSVWREKDEWISGKKTGNKVKSYEVDTDAYKKIETDITTKALSKLGFNADVFMGQFDNNKYVEAAKKAAEHQSLEALEFELKSISTIDDLMDYYYSNVWVSQSQGALKVFSTRRNQIADEAGR